ncbi:formyltransferase family protein [Streptomyces decoyicus]
MTSPLLCEPTLHAAFLVDAWGGRSDSGTAHPVYIREAADPALLERRLTVHAELAGSRLGTRQERSQVEAVYGALSPTDLAMVRMFGLPGLRAQQDSPYRQLGTTFNSVEARGMIRGEWPGRPVFVFLDEILVPDWLAVGDPPVINVHSAVLPHARGMHALEQVAASGDRERFLRAAGATVHYVDPGVDTGAVIRAERLPEPFGYESLWECKAGAFKLAFDLLTQVHTQLSEPGAVLLGTPQPSDDTPAFRRRTFDDGTAGRAAAQYTVWRTETEEWGRRAG